MLLAACNQSPVAPLEFQCERVLSAARGSVPRPVLVFSTTQLSEYFNKLCTIGIYSRNSQLIKSGRTPFF